MRSRVITALGSHKVSPVVTSFKPTQAAMSPARISSTSSRLLACICTIRPIRSFLPRTGVVHGVALFQNAGVHTHEGQLTHEGVGHQLECQGREFLFVIGLADDFFFVFVEALDGFHVQRRRHQFDDGIQHALHAFVLERGTAQHGLDFAVDGAHTRNHA